jgi:hypothetical protein
VSGGSGRQSPEEGHGNERMLKRAILPHIKAHLKPALKRGSITREKFKVIARHMTKKVR